MTEINLHATPEDIEKEIVTEWKRSNEIHVPIFRTLMESFGVITEEYYEVLEEFRKAKSGTDVERNVKLRVELTQLAAMCLKSVYSHCGVWKSVDDYVKSIDDNKISAAVNFGGNYCSTMDALGNITRIYTVLLISFDAAHNMESGSGVLAKDLYTLYLACKTAILSCCVVQN